MTLDFFRLRLLLATFTGWVSRDQAQVIAYLVEENRVLKEQMEGRRLRLTDAQRSLLAAKGKALGRTMLERIATIVTPDTIMRWHKRLIAAKWTYPSKRVGRPGIMKLIRSLIVRMATDNSGWGYRRIQGELKKLDHRVARSTIAKTLREHAVLRDHLRTVEGGSAAGFDAGARSLRTVRPRKLGKDRSHPGRGRARHGRARVRDPQARAAA